MTQELEAGQLWVPTKGKLKIGRIVTSRSLRGARAILVHYRTTTTNTSRWCWSSDFYAWITRTGAVLKEQT